MRFSAWLIDLDGTLYPARPVRFAMLAELLLTGPTSIPALRAFRSAHEHLRETLDEPVEASSTPFHRQLEIAAGKIGSSPDALAATVNRWMIRRPGKWLRLFRRRDLLREIAEFRAAGGRTALVSDYPARQKLRAMQIEDLFDVVVANGEEGSPRRLKPWPDGYLAAAERLGIAPADCLVIGDRDDADGEAAQRAGMRYAKIRPSAIND